MANSYVDKVAQYETSAAIDKIVDVVFITLQNYIDNINVILITNIIKRSVNYVLDVLFNYMYFNVIYGVLKLTTHNNIVMYFVNLIVDRTCDVFIYFGNQIIKITINKYSKITNDNSNDMLDKYKNILYQVDKLKDQPPGTMYSIFSKDYINILNENKGDKNEVNKILDNHTIMLHNWIIAYSDKFLSFDTIDDA